ncbi:MAG: hypothetical protein KGI90_17805 [Burkholderiales bacterium]|nr:hypothetical protein [Burkholderiales bacterium]MDE2277173.1 hypothetical protein [Burkholderiales bacterium]
MASPLAATGFKIVLWVSMTQFQAALPAQPGLASPTFPDTAAGAAEFMAWLRPRLPAPAWNAPPRQVCVVAAQAFPPGRRPSLIAPLYRSQPPWHGLEPYAATFHYVTAEDRRAGAGTRSLADALRLCAGPAAR